MICSFDFEKFTEEFAYRFEGSDVKLRFTMLSDSELHVDLLGSYEWDFDTFESYIGSVDITLERSEVTIHTVAHSNVDTFKDIAREVVQDCISFRWELQYSDLSTMRSAMFPEKEK